MFPGIRLATVHGQLPSQELASIMQRFDMRQIDVLISSTIIENGIDLPGANTLIVTRATNFGLSDLYQLRGRVGRRDLQGYAYFLYAQNEMTSTQRQRLAALTEASRLGSGWSLAQRDLEIRGAGNLLGAEQSGSVNAIGVQLYLDLVNEFIDQKERGVGRHDVDIQLPLESFIPAD
jgi:transcription-repair coupling factor (superfamily II helicase)